ncbi:MAG: N(4)-(beta-N-acetylglucosaminyl)-L-asparaginase [Phycisphaerales bacterium]|jgi:N4-(beta-N-acetylglucosaminyl)-L-asparaginase|nr:N(4)-(beta-N-acetylglucosaminyl)-L-asparaginase [Phycisphaerales bacterium]
MTHLPRRRFLTHSLGSALAVSLGAPLAHASTARPLLRPLEPFDPQEGDAHRGACAIASGNGLRTVERAMTLMGDGADPADAAVAGVAIVEDDPNDMSVGYGGLPNERCVVQLDASVMHGPLHRAGSVACIEDIKNPAAVALTVLKRTDHVMLVGPGAREFALVHGFKEENLLTDRAREAWLRWKEHMSKDDDWLGADERDLSNAREDWLKREAFEKHGIPFTYGTINCCTRNEKGEMASCTTTSGLSWKIPGRVGDSPIVGAGMYCDNDAGAAGATGRGEAVIQSCGSFFITELLRAGAAPTEACLESLRRIAQHTREKRLLDAEGRPNYQVVFYALRKDGAWGSASMRKGGTFAVCDAKGPRVMESVPLFE